MIPFRTIDLYIQRLTSMALLFTLYSAGLSSYAWGLYMLIIWQVISAAINTRSFLITNCKKMIRLFWIFLFFDGVLLALAASLPMTGPGQPEQALTMIALAGAQGIVIYYLFIYQRAVRVLEFKKEIKGVLKS